uniref:CXXC motif containing zinc binding protein n=1 Tax=Sinocyclocheilus grahami TaxID=75366 RepID=A0A672T4N4_SINGR
MICLSLLLKKNKTTTSLKCGNCGEVSDRWQYITLMDSMPLKGGRGSASMVQKCKLCSRENSIDILRDTITPYNAEDSERFKTIVQFECRGPEPVDFQPQVRYYIYSSTLKYMVTTN